MDYSKLLRLFRSKRIGYGDVIAGLAMILFAYQITGIFYTILETGMIGTAETKSVAAAAPSHPAFAREPEDFYRIIGERNLFGSTDKSVTDKQASGEQTIPLTALLQVRGTVAGDDRFGFAVIEERGKGKQGLFRIGDKVAGATVVRIMRDRVALRIAGKEEILKKAEAPMEPILPAGKPGAAPVPASSPSAGGRAINRSEIAGSLRDLGQMLSQAQIRQNFATGTPDGFIVNNIRPGSIYQRLGLTDGDVIQELNNRKIQSADDIIELYNTLKSGPAILLKIKRQGRQEQLDYIFQ